MSSELCLLRAFDYDFSLQSSEIQDTLFSAHLMIQPYKLGIFYFFSNFYDLFCLWLLNKKSLKWFFSSMALGTITIRLRQFHLTVSQN